VEKCVEGELWRLCVKDREGRIVEITWESEWRENCGDYVEKCVEGELWKLCGKVSGGRIVEIRWKSVEGELRRLCVKACGGRIVEITWEREWRENCGDYVEKFVEGEL
jgi:hypothetical protein